MFSGMARVFEESLWQAGIWVWNDRRNWPQFRSQNQAGLLLFWLMLKQSAETAEGMDRLLKVVGVAKTGVDTHRGVELLKKTVPAFSDALAPNRLRAALTNGEEMKALHRELSEL